MLPGADVFNYGALPADKAATARAAAERIRARLASAIIETGHDLIAQKADLGHGNFLPWIRSEFGMSEDTAQKFMRIARELGENTESSRYLSFEALAKLAAPSTPELVRTEVLERAAKGEKVTAKEIEALKRQLAKAEETIADKEAQRRAQEGIATSMSRAANDQSNRAMFAEAEKERLAEQVAALQEELERATEPGVVNVTPTASVQTVTKVVTPSLLLQVFDISSDAEVAELLLERRARLMGVENSYAAIAA